MEALRGLLDADPGLLEAEHAPLHYACRAGSVEAARLLLDRGAGIDSTDADWVTALMVTSEHGRSEVAALLLARGADPTLRSSGGWTALMVASDGPESPGSDHVAVIRLLLKEGHHDRNRQMWIDARDNSGSTALLCACYVGYTERARVLLLEGRADHTIADDDGLTPMAEAQREGRHDCVLLLQVSRQSQASACLDMALACSHVC